MKWLCVAVLSCAATASPTQPIAIPLSDVVLRFDATVTKASARRLDDSTTTLVDQEFGMVEMIKTQTTNGWIVAISSTCYIATTILVSVVDATAARFSWTNSISIEGDETTCASDCKILVVVPARSHNRRRPSYIEFLSANSDGQFTIKVENIVTGDPTTSYDDTSLVPPLMPSSGKVFVDQGYNGSFSQEDVNALDLRCNLGDPVYAARDGVVWLIVEHYSGQCTDRSTCASDNLLANVVYIVHCDSTWTSYAHLDGPNLVNVEVGDYVRAREDVLGPCGTTGFSTGPHLHFEASAAQLDEGRVSIGSIQTRWDDCVAPSFVPSNQQSFQMDGAACSGGFACRKSGDGSKKKKSDSSTSTELAIIDFVAFMVMGSIAFGFVVASIRLLPSSSVPGFRDIAMSLVVLLLAWFVTYSDIAMTCIEYKAEVSHDAWAFSAASLVVAFSVHLATTVVMLRQYGMYDVNWTREHKFVVFPALFMTIPALDGLSLVIPWNTRPATSAFPTRRLCAMSFLRVVLLDSPQFLLKLIVYQTAADFSMFACSKPPQSPFVTRSVCSKAQETSVFPRSFVSSAASLCLIVILLLRFLALVRAAPRELSSEASRRPCSSSANVEGSDRNGPLFVPPPIDWEPPCTVETVERMSFRSRATEIVALEA